MRMRPAVTLAAFASAFAATALAGFAGTDLFIPMEGRGVGAYPSNCSTTVYLHNPNAAGVTIDLTFLERNKDNVAIPPPVVTDTLSAGETRLSDKHARPREARDAPDRGHHAAAGAVAGAGSL